jgi:Photosynthesis system II assembly factor YCF48
MTRLNGGRAGIAALALAAVLAFGVRGTFSVSPTPPASQLAAVAFQSPAAGHGLFEQQGATTCSDSIGTTADGGARFTALARVASWRCAGNAPAGWLAFDDQGDGFLYGPKLFTSHDGGASWAPSAQPGAVLAVDAVGRSVWMLEQVCAPGARSTNCPLRLLQSGDGGRSFTPAAHQPPLTLSRTFVVDPDSAQGQSWLVRVNARAAYVLAPPSGGDSTPLLYTSDGGGSWSGRTSPCPAGLSTVLSVAPGGALFAVCAGEPSAGAQAKSSAVSTDGGRTWTEHVPCPNLNLCTTALSQGYLGEVDATSASTAYVIGDRSALLVTRDGGSSWTALGDVGDANGEPAQVAFFGASDGLVLGRANTVTAAVTIWDTSDGGRSWTAVVPSIG